MHELLTEEQMRHLRGALRGHELEAIVLLALATGMRRDELLQLHWHELDVEQREVRVRNSKTGSGWRRVRFPEEVADVLRQYRLRQRHTRLEAGMDEPHLDLVFPGRTGGMLRSADLLEGWYDVLAQAALPALRFHDLRLAHGRALHEQSRAAGERHHEEQE